MPDLVTLRPGLTLDRPAAYSWARMEAERGAQLDVNRSYADYDTQMRYYLAYQAYLAGRGPIAPLALHPDQSWHCLGLAVDTDDDAWIRARPGHGWRFVVASERWHAQYYANLDDHRFEGRPATGGEVDMPLNDDDKGWIRECIRQEIASTFAAVNDIKDGKILFPDAEYYAFPAVVNTFREERNEG